jgi:Zn-dependent protease with chaperone function
MALHAKLIRSLLVMIVTIIVLVSMYAINPSLIGAKTLMIALLVTVAAFTLQNDTVDPIVRRRVQEIELPELRERSSCSK